MQGWVTVSLLGALGFVLGYFYTRTMRLSVKLPELYVTKEECKGDRELCRHFLGRERDELLERIDRIEFKLDRLIERILA